MILAILVWFGRGWSTCRARIRNRTLAAEVPMRPDKRCLGDGVYIAFDGYMVVLTTEDGVSATNTIYLEPAVVAQFLAWLKDTQRAT